MKWLTSRGAADHVAYRGKLRKSPRCALASSLGLVEEAEGNPDQARHWYQQAIATGHPDAAPEAMINFAILEAAQGNPDLARFWYQQAINTDQTKIVGKAQQQLRALDRYEEDRQRGEFSGRYGYLAHADRL
jgi:tetratricopeptide (TPR) repeat protein